MFVRFLRTLAPLVLVLASMGHIGSPDTYFSGEAGPYAVRVVVRYPGVIPGRAQVAVRVAGTTPETIERVDVRAALWAVGIEGAPPAERAAAVAGDPELYAAELWFMAPTSYRLFVTVAGPRGTGTAIVPTVALATAQNTMTPGLGAVLLGLGAFLAIGLLTIVGCAVRESGLPPGEAPDAPRRRRARLAIGVAAVLVGVTLWGGHLWWSAEAASYGRFVLYRPFATEAAVEAGPAGPRLRLGIRDERWPARRDPTTRWNDLLPDHGKLMHLFVVRERTFDAFAHLHPVADNASAQAFTADVPDLPGGRYAIFADIVHESGYAQTLQAAIDVPPFTARGGGSDPDDSSYLGGPETGPIGRVPDAGEIEWVGGGDSFAARAERTLTFRARDRSGAPLSLEPYMGMLAHAVVLHEDGSVFTHLHPGGTISMAALQRFAARDRTVAGPPHAHESAPAASEVSIPYAFPKPGPYRIWVQMKHHGTVRTVAFRKNVEK